MALTKRTYTLTPETLQRFEQTVRPGERSAMIGELIERWLMEKEKAELRRLVIEGCREMADEMLQIEAEFHPLEEEVARNYGE
ncbi:MAG: hypothetical protein H7308_05810 [Chthonomonadaceae bacterium]|nr:hypothetical protein [Chthonomonadaceae bacterium]